MLDGLNSIAGGSPITIEEMNFNKTTRAIEIISNGKIVGMIYATDYEIELMEPKPLGLTF